MLQLMSAQEFQILKSKMKKEKTKLYSFHASTNTNYSKKFEFRTKNTKRLCFLMTQYQLIYELRKKLLTELLV